MTSIDKLLTKYGKNRNQESKEPVREDKRAPASGRNYRQTQRHQPLYLEDGVDHINLWTKGRTPLGRILSMEAEITEELDVLGAFRSVFALWTFLTTRNRMNALRVAPAPTLRQFLKTREQEDNVVDHPNTQFLCACMIGKFIDSNPEIQESLIASGDAPLVSYIETDKGRLTHPQANWWVNVIKLIRAELIAGKKLDYATFEAMLDTDDTLDDILSLPDVQQPQKLGMIAKRQPVKEAKQPRPQKQKPQAEAVSREDQYREYLTPSQEQGTVRAVFENKERRDFFMRTLISAEQDVFQDILKGLLASDERGEGEFFCYIHYNVTSMEMMGLATAAFFNPYDDYDRRTISVNPDETLLEKAIEVMGLSSLTTLEDLNPILVKKKGKIETEGSEEVAEDDTGYGGERESRYFQSVEQFPADLVTSQD